MSPISPITKTKLIKCFLSFYFLIIFSPSFIFEKEKKKEKKMPSSSPLTKIPLIQRCILFTPDLSVSQALQLAFVSTPFAETIIDFHYTLETIISHQQHNTSNAQEKEEKHKEQRLVVEYAIYKIVKSSQLDSTTKSSQLEANITQPSV